MGDFLLGGLETILFLAAEPVSVEEICSYLEIGFDCGEKLIRSLDLRLKHGPGALCLKNTEGKYYLSLKDEFRPVAESYYRPGSDRSLSAQAYEALAAVAYLQPVTRAQVESVRGVNSDHLINRLQAEGLIEEAGKLDLPGRPQSFKVSQKFWQEFGYSGPKDLPSLDLSMYTSLQDLSKE